MTEAIPNDSKKEEPLAGLKHPTEFEEFVAWTALPTTLRKPETQAELAENFGVGSDTLSEWKQRQGFWNLVRDKKKEWCRERTPNVILGLYRKAVKDGSAAEVKLWLQYVENWDFSEKTMVKEVQEKVVLSPAPDDPEIKAKIIRLLEIRKELKEVEEQEAILSIQEDDKPDKTNNQIVSQ